MRVEACLLAALPVLAVTSAACAQTYYVNAVSGNDNNSGLSPNSPWQSVTKVDDTNFAPGSTILFQAGDNWYGSLSATSSGTASAPITYGSYGSGSNPTFWGSNILPTTSFQPVSGASDTYFVPTSTTVNSFFVNHQFASSAALATDQTADAANISYVESNPNSWYYESDGTSPGLYVNTGAAISSSNIYTAAVRQDVVSSNSQSNLVFENLTVQESAAYANGYAFNIFGGANVKVLNSTAIAAGKHAFGAIDTTNFLGEGLSASYLMPGQGYGGATAFVAYSDYSVANTTSQWINDSFTNANGPYQAFITHSTPSASDPTPISSVLLQNLYTTASPAIAIYTAGNETVNIVGGKIDNGGAIGIEGNNVTITGLTLTGANASIHLDGNNNIVQNSLINGAIPSWWASFDGAIVDNGQNNTIQYNTILLGPSANSIGAAIALESNSTDSTIVGNIIQTPYAIFFMKDPGLPQITASNNTIATTQGAGIYYDYDYPINPVDQWPAYLFDPTTNSLVPLGTFGITSTATTSQLVINQTGSTTFAGILSDVTPMPTQIVLDGAAGSMLTLASANNYSGGTIINSGTLVAAATGALPAGKPVVNNGNLKIAGASAIVLGNSSGAGAITGTGSLTLGDGLSRATLQLAPGSGISTMSSLSIAPGSTLDLTNNAIAINYGSAADQAVTDASVLSYLSGASYNENPQTGTNIFSSLLAGNTRYAIGEVDGNDRVIGSSVAANTLELAYTLKGDLNLDGVVDSTDFTILVSHFGQAVSGIGWEQGDINGDGIVNQSDFLALVSNFGASNNSADVVDISGAGVGVYVPEPATAGLVVLPGFVIALRRRRTSH